MPDRGVRGQMTSDVAVRLVDERLAADLGIVPERLDAGRLRAAYPRRAFVDGWRIPVDCSDGQTRRIDLLIGSAFPAAYPRTALVDRPNNLEWPHVEGDGVMCLLPIHAEVDAGDPAAVAVNLLARSARLIEELLAGDIVERDFREEFLTYWFYGSDVGAPKVRSLLRPGGPSRMVRVWRDRGGAMTVAEDAATLERWLANLSGSPHARKTCRHEPAALVWLPTPPVPADYPIIGADVVTLAATAGPGASGIVEELAAATVDNALVVFGAEGRGGAGLIAVETTVAHRRSGARGGTEHPLTQGFRAAPLPAGVAASRMFSAAPVRRLQVDRADARWIHGRGRDPRIERLIASTVVVIGCGSLGSSVAARLARAGVGRLHLVDNDALSWSNVGRHELGADCVGFNKAKALAERLRREFPHMDVAGHDLGMHVLLSHHERLLIDADLIVAATGSWGAEGALDRWHVATGRNAPIVYGWLEDLALAAHAVTISKTGGCLRCGFGPTGVPLLPALDWPSGRTEHEEPACGNHYQPYGAVELGFAVDLVATTSLNALLERPAESVEHVWLTARANTVAAGATLAETLTRRSNQVPPVGGLVTAPWPKGCEHCTNAINLAA